MAFWISFSCYFLVGVGSLAFGIIYMTRSEFMPYHAKAIGKEWKETEPNIRFLILMLMRVAGSGMVGAGIMSFILLYIPFRNHETWAIFTLPFLGLIMVLTTLYVTSKVKRNTPASPPVGFNAGCLCLILVGFVLSLI